MLYRTALYCTVQYIIPSHLTLYSSVSSPLSSPLFPPPPPPPQSYSLSWSLSSPLHSSPLSLTPSLYPNHLPFPSLPSHRPINLSHTYSSHHPHFIPFHHHSNTFWLSLFTPLSFPYPHLPHTFITPLLIPFHHITSHPIPSFPFHHILSHSNSRSLRQIVGGIETEMEGREKEGQPPCLPRGIR